MFNRCYQWPAAFHDAPAKKTSRNFHWAGQSGTLSDNDDNDARSVDIGLTPPSRNSEPLDAMLDSLFDESVNSNQGS
jgi:hypothetical protein